MNCPKCNQELPDGVRFCVHCGSRIVKDCPGCGKTLAADHEVCEFCGLNVDSCEENARLATEGKKLEQKSDYEGAKAIYEKMENPRVPEVSQLLEGVTRKLETISDNRKRADELIKSERWKEARQSLINIRKQDPTSEFAATGLTSVRIHTMQKARKAVIVVCAIIAITAGVVLYRHVHSVHYLAMRGLRTLLHSDDLEVKNSAALVLGWQGDRAAAPTLRLLANSGDMRKSAYSSAALLQIDASTAITALRKIMQEGDVATTLGAAYVLTQLGDTLIVPELASYLSIPNENLRIGASVLLFNFGYSLGIPVVQKALTDTLPSSRFKGLYALYLLGNKEMLPFHEDNWAPVVKNLLWDKSSKIRVLAAFLLNEFSRTLSPQDSVAIEHIMWEEYVRGAETMPKVDEIAEISAFHVAKGIINQRGDEDISESARSVRQVRQKCNNALSKIELDDETIMSELVATLDSGDRYERLYASVALLKTGNRRSVAVLKKLLNERDEHLKLDVCKLAVEFI